MKTFCTEILVFDFKYAQYRLVEGPEIEAMDIESANVYLESIKMTWCRITGEKKGNEIFNLKTIN